MSDDDYERGRTAERLDINEERHLENKERLDEIEEKLDQVVEAITMVKSGARLLYSVGIVGAGIGATVSAFFHWAAGHIKW